jgi:hypothetical protein
MSNLSMLLVKNSRQFDKTKEIIQNVKDELAGIAQINVDKISYTYGMIDIPTSLKELDIPAATKIKNLKGEVVSPDRKYLWIKIRIPNLISYLHLGSIYLITGLFLLWNINSIEAYLMMMELYIRMS